LEIPLTHTGRYALRERIQRYTVPCALPLADTPK
jgi:hypothetical protein